MNFYLRFYKVARAATIAVLILYVQGADGNSQTKRGESKDSPQHAGARNPKELSFGILGSGRMLKKGATSVVFRNYKASDGVFLQERVETYPSVAFAQEEVKRVTGRASKVVEPHFPTSSVGSAELERVLLYMGAASSKDQRFLLIRRIEERIYVISAPSKEHAIAFERTKYPGTTQEAKR